MASRHTALLGIWLVSMSFGRPAEGGQIDVMANVAGAFYSDLSPAPLGDLTGQQATSLIYQIDFFATAITSPGEREFGAAAFNLDLSGLSVVPGTGWNPSEAGFSINGDLGPSSADLEGIVISKSIIGAAPHAGPVHTSDDPIPLGSIYVEWDGQSPAALKWHSVQGGFLLDTGKFGSAMNLAEGSLEFGSSLIPDVPLPIVSPPAIPEELPPAEPTAPFEPQLPPSFPEDPASPVIPEVPPAPPLPADPMELPEIDPGTITVYPATELELVYWIGIEQLVLDPLDFDQIWWPRDQAWITDGAMLFDVGSLVTTNASGHGALGHRMFATSQAVPAATSQSDSIAAQVPEPSTIVLSLLGALVTVTLRRRV